MTPSPKTGKEEQESPFKDHCAQDGAEAPKAALAGPVKLPTIPRRHAGRKERCQ